MAARSVVITGVGVVAPGLANYSRLDDVIEQGTISCSKLERFRTDECKTKLAFQIDPSLLGPVPDDPIRRPLIVRYGERVLADALAMAKLDRKQSEPTCVFGTTVGGTWEMEAVFGSLSRFISTPYEPVWGALDAASLQFPGQLIFQPLGAKHLRTLTTGCTAGLDALGNGWMDIQQGADCAVVVAAEAPLGPLNITSFDQINALTKETREPLKASMPFCKQRCGFCIGEGAAAFVLEEESVAKRRGARILAALRGYATTSSAFHMCAIHQEGEAIRISVEEALKVSGVSPDDVALIVAHATSTKQNDNAEHSAFQALFGEKLAHIPMYCGKANFGHALGASNLIETAASVRALETGIVGRYARRKEREVAFDDVCLPEVATKLKGRIAIKNSSGFSGIHSAVVLEGRDVSA